MTLSRLFVRVGLIIACILLAIGTAAPAAAVDCTPGITITGENTNALENEGVLIVVFIADGTSDCDIEIPYTLTADTASGSDYGAGSPTSPLLIPIGETVATLEIPITEDDIDEVNEMFTVEIGTLVNATFGSANPIGTIIDNDTASLSVNDVTVTEGDAGTTNATFTLALNRATGFDVTVDVATAGDTAASGVDYATVTSTVTFSAGQTSKTVTVDVTGEADAEPQERFFLNLSNRTPVSIIMADSQGIGTIDNDDAPLSVNDVTVTEGNTGTTCATFTVSIPFASVLTASVTYATSNIVSEAVAGSDYTAKSNALTFTPGQTSKTVCVDVLGENIHEDDETFAITLSSPSNAALSDADGVGTITNDDAIPTLNIANQSVTEGTDSMNTFMLTATLTGRTEDTVTATVDTADGTADSSDYTGLVAQTLTISPEQTSGTVNISIITDFINEPNETFTATLSSPVNATGGSLGPVTVTITDDDVPPVVSVSDATCVETDTACTFTVSVDEAKPYPVTVDYSLSNNSATAGVDYNGTGGAFTIPANQISAVLGVSVGAFDDAIYEGSETFTLTLLPTSGLVLGDSTGTGTITDNESLPTITIGDVLNIVEGGTGTQANANFSVTITPASASPVSVAYTLVDDSATVADLDYLTPAVDNDAAPNDGIVTFTPGQTTRTITVTVKGDAKRETTERFFVNLSSPNGAGFGDNSATGRILNDDPVPTVNLAASTLTCNETDLNAPCTLNLILSNPSESTITVNASTANGTALSGQDYTALSAQVVSFAPNTTSSSVSVTITGDDIDEPSETFTLAISGPFNASLGATTNATFTIEDDDDAPVLSVVNQSFAEGSSGAGMIGVVFGLVGQTSQAIVVDYTLTGISATQGDDYTGTGGQFTIPALGTGYTLTIAVDGDTTYEGDETFSVNITNVTVATLGNSTAVITLTNDDLAPLVSAADLECAEDAVICTVTVTLDTASDIEAEVNYATSNGTATAAQDYAAASGTLTFAPGVVMQVIPLDIGTFDDAIFEGNEAFTITFINPSNARLEVPPTTILTILDNESPPTLILSGVTLAEPNSGTTTATVTFTLSAPVAGPVTVNFATENGTALSGSDYTARSGQFSIPAGQLTHTETFAVIGDIFAEATESFAVRATGVINAVTDATNPATVTITDNDAVRLSIADQTCTEGNPPSNPTCSFTVTADAPALNDIVIAYTLSDLTSESDDFNHTGGTVTILQAATTVTIPVSITGDLNFEFIDTFNVVIETPINATLTDGTAVGTIPNDDAQPVISITNPGNAISLTEGNTGTVSGTLSLALNVKSDLPVIVTVTSADGTATAADSDFTPINQTVTIPAGSLTGSLSFDVHGDLKFESDEQFSLTLSSPQDSSIGGGEGALAVTITNDDGEPTLSINDVSQAEGSSATPNATTNFVFALTLSNPTSQTVTALVNTAALTATSGTDYVALSGQTVTFAPGTTSQTVTVQVYADQIYEADQTFTVALSGLVGATFTDSSGLGSIINDDAKPVIATANVTESEGSAGSRTLSIVFTLTGQTEIPTSITVSTANDTAQAGSDYTAISGQVLTFAPGDTSKTLAVTVNGDTTYERTEAFSVSFSVDAASQIGSPSSAVVTLTNDDLAPLISAANISCSESAVTCSLIVTLDAASDIEARVNYATSNGTATAAQDYAAASGTLTFAPGVVMQVIPLDIGTFDDAIYEGDEAFTVTFSAPVDARLPMTPTATVTITENDAQPTLTLTGVTVTEGNSGTTSAVVSFSLNTQAALPITVNFATENGTALSGSDYTARSGQFVIPAGQLVHTEDFAVIGDIFAEHTESFGVRATSVTNAVLDGSNPASVTITDDDAVRLSITDQTCTEGNPPSNPTCSFTVTADSPALEAIVIPYSFVNVTSESDDFNHTGGTVTILQAATTVTIPVSITGDLNYEFDDSFNVVIETPINAALTDGTGVGTIPNDDAQPTITIGNAANSLSVTEGTGVGTTPANVSLALSAKSDLVTSVTVTSADASATAVDPDYVAFNASVSIPAGSLTAPIPFAVTADDKFEVDQSFTFTLTSPVNGSIGAGEDTGVVVIVNDDSRPTVSVNDIDQAEGSSATPGATTIYNFTVSLSNPSDEVVQVNITTADDTAVAPGDYVGLATTTLIFSAESTSQVYSTAVYADQKYENDEQFRMVLTVPLNSTLGDATGLGIIRNDDAQPVLVLSGESKPEGSSGVNTFTVTFTLSGQTNLPVTFDYATGNGSATTGDGDYTGASGSHTFTPGETSFALSLSVNGDTKFERDEAFQVELTGLSGATSNVPMATLTLQNDDDAPTVTVADTSCSENAVSCIFTITLSAASGVDARVDYTTSNGTATAGQDYTATSGTFIIPMGQVGGTVHVPVGLLNDNIYEGNETLTFTLSAPVDATLGSLSSATGTILENDPQPTLTVQGQSLPEGDSDTSSAMVSFSLSAAAALPITVDFTTEDGTALAGSDYTARSGQFTIPAGQLTHSETFTILTDTLAENDEAFGVRVTSLTNAVTNASNPAVVTITNDDPMRLSIADQTCAEGATCSFTVTLDVAALADIQIAYSFANITSEADDFNHTGGTVTLLQGQTTATIPVAITADTDYEFEDTFSVVLTDPTNADLSDGTAVGTIPNDDTRPTLTATVTTLSLNEGNAGVTAFGYPLTLSAKSDETITVHAASADGTALVSDSDYAALNATITFAPGVTSQTVTVNVTGDTKLEADETFSAALSSAMNTTINAGSESLSGTILNDDAQPTVSVADLTLVEGTNVTPGATTAFNVIVSLSNPSEQPITVDVATADNAQADSADYISVPTTTLTFAPGTSTQTVIVNVYADAIYEDDESFLAQLSAPTNVTILDGVAIILISNDDALPTLSLQNQTFAEGSAGAHSVNLAVSLTNPSENPVFFSFDTTDGTATVSDSDYVGIFSGGYTITPGQNGLDVAVSIDGDTKFELDETFSAVASGVIGAQNGALTATYTLTNDDAVPTLSVVSRTCAEADTDTTCSITVSLSNPSYLTVTAIFNTSDGTATSPADYASVSGLAVTLPAGVSQTSVPVSIVGDDIYEQNQTFGAALSAITNASNGTLNAVITISDDDDAPTLSFQNPTVAVNEGDSGTATITFTLVQSAVTEVTTSFNLALNNQTAELGSDYAALSAASGSIAPGAAIATVSVTVNGDTDYEPDETFELAVTAITNANPVSLSGMGQITNDDLKPFINVTAGNATEKDFGQTSTCPVTLTLSNRSTETVSVTVVSQNGTATSGGLYPDYTPFFQVIEFPPLTSEPVALNFQVLGDILYEGSTPETISVILGGEDNARGVQTGAACQIIENDVKPTVSITGASVLEGNIPGQNTMPVALTLSGPSTEIITAFVSTSDGSNSTPALEADADYVPLVLATVTFNPLETAKGTTVSITGDLTYETDETFMVNIASATNATVSPTTHTANYLILNDEPLPTLTLFPLASPILEGTGGTNIRAAFQAQLDIESALPVTFTWEVFGGTASAAGLNQDFSPTSETGVTFAPGVTSLVIGPLVTQDSAYELSETLSLRVINVSGATPSPAVPSGTLTISDDDAIPSLGVNPILITEGNSGKQMLRFALSNPTYKTVTFTAITATGTATQADNDFTALTGLNPVTSMPFEITPFATVVDVAIITGDTIVELDETFTVTITAAGNAGVPSPSFTVTIDNDDALPDIAVGTASVVEGAPATTAVVSVPVTLNRQSDAIVTASICATDGTATVAGNDYVQACKPVTFSARDTSETVTFTVNGDNIYEKLSGGTVDPHFVVSVTSPVNGAISGANGSANITITDDDPIPTLTLTTLTASVIEGTGGTPNTAQFRVDLSNPTEQAVTITYETFGVDTEAADYTALAGAVLSLPANTLTASFSVTVSPDDIDEPDSETFGVRITALTNAAATLPLTNTAVISDDDATPVISITGDSKPEGESLTIGLTLSRQSESSVSVVLNTADGTALATGDYSAVTNQTITFAPLTTTQSTTVATTEDTVREFDEAFTLTMSAPTNATLSASPSVTLTITNEDSTVLLELVTNPSFEGNILAPWKLGKVFGADKIVCGTTAGPGTKSFDGLCSFQFTGNAGPKAQLQGIFDRVAIETALGAAPNDIGTEDVLRITFAYRAKATANKPVLRVQAFTSKTLKPKLLDQPLAKVSDWATHSVDVPLTTLSFTSLRVLFIDNSASGKWLLDDISVIYIDNAPGGSRDETLPGALPLPANPAGFRGGN